MEVPKSKVKLHLSSGECSCVSEKMEAAEDQNLEDKVRSLKRDTEESQSRQRHLEVEVKSFPEVLDRKIHNLHDFRPGLAYCAPITRAGRGPGPSCESQACVRDQMALGRSLCALLL